MSWARSVRKAPLPGSAYVPDTVNDVRRTEATAAKGLMGADHRPVGLSERLD